VQVLFYHEMMYFSKASAKVLTFSETTKLFFIFFEIFIIITTKFAYTDIKAKMIATNM